MKTLANCPDSATPTLALPPPWGRARVEGFATAKPGILLLVTEALQA